MAFITSKSIGFGENEWQGRFEDRSGFHRGPRARLRAATPDLGSDATGWPRDGRRIPPGLGPGPAEHEGFVALPRSASTKAGIQR